MSDDKTVDIFDLSDEEFMALDPATLEAPASEKKDPEDGDDATGTNDAPAEAGAEGAEATDDGVEEGDEGDEPSGQAPEGGTEVEPAGEAEIKPVAPASPDGDATDYKAFHAAVTAPFRANSREMQVHSAEEAVQLMQMGANYNKKMSALKPNLQLLKMLENHGLLDAAKLSYLIDLDKKNPDAIKKLVKDSGIDPLDMDVEKQSEYKPNTYTADEREVELDQVLDEIQDTPTYAKTANLVSNKWDAASKQVVANNPQLLKVLNDHMASGVYDVISTELERERMLGRLTGMSDVVAYQKVGDAIQARGGFDHLFQTQPPKDVTPQHRPAADARRNDRRRAAGSTSAAPTPAKEAEFNPLAMSDEDFARQTNGKFL